MARHHRDCTGMKSKKRVLMIGIRKLSEPVLSSFTFFRYLFLPAPPDRFSSNFKMPRSDMSRSRSRSRGRSRERTRSRSRSPPPKKNRNTNDSELHSIRVGNDLPANYTEEELKEQFTKWGEIGDIYMPKQFGKSGDTKGYGFVRFFEKDDCEACFDDCQKEPMDSL